MNPTEYLGILNSAIKQGSSAFQSDATSLAEAISEIPSLQFSDDERIDQQLKACMVFDITMFWLSQHPEDANSLMETWSNHVGDFYSENLHNDDYWERGG